MKARVIEWTGAPQMDTGAPMPHIKLLPGRKLLCAYIVSEPTLHEGTKEEFAIVAFRGATQFTFGYPNDEALPAHPLYKIGVSYYAFNRIENSPYLIELGRRNATRFPGSESFWTEKEHYLVAFHDETLEVICSGIEFVNRTTAESAIDALNKTEAEQGGAGQPATRSESE